MVWAFDILTHSVTQCLQVEINFSMVIIIISHKCVSNDNRLFGTKHPSMVPNLTVDKNSDTFLIRYTSQINNIQIQIKW